MTKPFTPTRYHDGVAERLLRSTALKIELPPSQHRLACERKAAVEAHLQRPASPLRFLVALFYQQGSMAIGATIRAKHREDGYDIDIVVELRLGRDTPPDRALDLLYQAVREEPGSRYYDMVERQTRCVTIRYADGMHLDLTPSILVQAVPPRGSLIFHAKPEEPRHMDRRIRMNSYAFVNAFNEACPADTVFALDYGRMARLNDRALVNEAESEEVPAHSSTVGAKSVTVVALQLIKRFRVLRYRARTGRMPPSVMLSCFALEAARPGRLIAEALVETANHIHRRLKAAQAAGELIDLRNPRDREDRFTDRWPATLNDQATFIADLEWFARKLAVLLDETRPLRERGDALEALFGEGPGRAALDETMDALGRDGPVIEHKAATLHATPPLASPRIAPAKPVSGRANTFYGPGKWRGA
ncbi:MAG: nucleotidyltransferase [Jannaschia sp.]